MSILAVVERSYRNKLTLSYLSQIKPHLIIISELSRKKSQKKTVICPGCASLRKGLLPHLYTTKLQKFSYISATFEATVWFYNVIGVHQRQKVEKNGCLYLQIDFEGAVFDDRSGILVANIDHRS